MPLDDSPDSADLLRLEREDGLALASVVAGEADAAVAGDVAVAGDGALVAGDAPTAGEVAGDAVLDASLP